VQIVSRDFQPQDLPELEQMMGKLYAEDPEGEPITRDKLCATVQELATHPAKGRIVILTVEQAIVGYALVIFYWRNEYGGNIVHIDELYVKGSWRNRGIATQFLADLQHWDSATTKALQLEVTPSNDRAYAYYQKLGFVPSPNTHLVKKAAP
jgi:ribosomal protein S18 acetylase RimI-like enzyme